MSFLFQPLQLRNIVLKNRIGIPPMCQYSAEEGAASGDGLLELLDRGGEIASLEERTGEVIARLGDGEAGVAVDGGA